MSKLPSLDPVVVLVKMVNVMCFVQVLDLILDQVVIVPMVQSLNEDNFPGFF